MKTCTAYVSGPCVPLTGAVEPPGNKNTAMPSLVAGVLSRGGSRVTNVPNLADIRQLDSIFASLGLDTALHDGSFTTAPRTPTVPTIPGHLSTTLRGSVYTLAILARFFKKSMIGEIGGDTLAGRTLEPHARVLAGYGVTMSQRRGGWGLNGGPARPGEFVLGDRQAGVTASCLALVLGASLEGRSVIREVSDELEVRDMIDCVTAMGASVEFDGSTIVVGGPMCSIDSTWSIPGDQIYCGTMAFAAALTGGEVSIPRAMAPRMPAVLSLLGAIGVRVRQDVSSVRFTGRGSQAIDWETGAFPGFPSDLGPQVTALFTQADGRSSLRENLYEQRFDHFAGLRALGADVRADGANATILGPRRLRGSRVRGGGIRETAALVLAALVAEGTTTIECADALYRGYEDLPRDLAAMGAEVATAWDGPADRS